ncbi:uncharacterized protein LOC106088415 isoform X18 [Stomoxys calcitrans]|uniref:uncharacterized protein LOC106088415 isoform X17 n=1 Tax=Stomoxys calcitrans TaxID=35570 RepID=UPI0027E2910B|nr:uncharacterized protein LOC106088415 isoform X17 [Stomoxys calcitrans]XP_059226648.1 uncharacterized protein LOC106088415 isoform X18 [Stomoxys calcitrans]
MERKKVLEPFYQQTKALNISCPSPNVSSIKNSTLEDISIKNKGSKQKDTTYQDCYSIPNGQLITSDFYNNHEEPIIQIPEPNQSNNSLIISLSQLSDPSISNFDSDCYIINSGVETALTVIKEIEKENKLKQTKKSRNNSEFFEQKENLNTTTPDITELLNILETNKNTQNLFIENSKEENNYASTDEYSYFEKNVNFNSTFIEIEKGIESNTEKNEKDIINFKQRSPKDFTEKTKDVKNVNLIIGEVKEKINKAETTNQKLKQERNKYQQNNMENKRIKEEMEMLIKMRNTDKLSTINNQQTKIYFIQCLGCTTIFLIGSQIPIMTLTYEILNNENSTINKHCKLTNHPKPEGKTPVQIQIQGDHIPASQQIILIKTIFETIGYECKTNQQIALLPQLVRKGIVRALAQNEGIKM